MTNYSFKAVALNQSSHMHYNDHLAPICTLLDIPLLFVEEEDYLLCQRWYPQLNCLKVEYEQFNPEYLVENFDVLFMSDLWDRNTFSEKFAPLEEEYGKRLRNVHCPHGFSDKGYYLRKAANEDITLVYGQNMLDLFKEERVLDHLNEYVIVGNLRYQYYLDHKEHFDKIVEHEVLSKFNKQKQTILYAPTWLDLEEASTFFDSYTYLLEKVPEKYNLIVKLHPQLELDDTTLYYKILGKYQEKDNILFVTSFPIIYPLLNRADIYIGDVSSIGYDYLIFNRPMFFLNKLNKDPAKDRKLYLFKTGVDLRPHQFPKLYQIIEENLDKDMEKFGKVRKEVWDYTFAKGKTKEEVKTEIVKVCSSES